MQPVGKKLKRNFIFSIALSLLLLILFLAGTYKSMHHAVETSNWVEHSDSILKSASDVLAVVNLAERNKREFILTGDSIYLTNYNKEEHQALQLLVQIERLVKGSPSLVSRIHHLDSITKMKFGFMHRLIYIREHEGKHAAEAALTSTQGQRLLEHINSDLQIIFRHEEEMLHKQAQSSNAATKDAYMIITIEGVLAFLLIVGTVIAIYRDIRKKSKLQEAVAISERQYRLLVETMKEGLLYINNENIICFVNKQFCDMTGYRKEELLGCSTAILIPDDVRHVVEGKRELRKLGISDQYELPVRKKNGEIIWTSISGTPVKDADGNITGTIGTHLDITEKRKAALLLEKSEQRYQELVYHLPAYVCTHDMSGILMSVNPAITRALGYEADEMTGKPISSFIAPGFIHEFDTYLAGIAADHHVQGLLCLVTREGEKRVWSYSNLRMEKDDGSSYIIGLAMDVTDRVQVENELKKAKQIAEQSAAMKEQFMANMSHEIRTPMNAVIGFTDLLRQTQLSSEQKEFVSSIKTSGESLLSIINDILDFSKIEAGMIQLETVPFSISQLARSVHTMLLPKAKQKDLSFILEHDERIPGYVSGDPTRLTQVLINLTGNAIKFTEKGSVTVSTKLARQTGDVSYITFVVKDTGIGIAPGKQKEVFERFTQASTETTRKYGGTGLGLCIARQLVTLQGGDMQLTSEPGAGSEFTFTIPYRKTGIAPVTQVQQSGNAATLQGKRVLLVEDNEMNRRLAVKVLSNMGIVPDIAVNGNEGVSRITENEYDLVLMDIQMPGMDGYEAARYIRTELRKSTPIIAMTAHAMAGEKEKCIELGMNDYISKPFHSNDLYNKILNLVSRKNDASPASSLNTSRAKQIDLTYLRDLAAGDNNFVKEMLELFVNRIPGESDQLAGTADNAEENSKAAHRLKPIAGYIGYQHVVEALEKLEYNKPENEERKDLSLFAQRELTSAVEQVQHLLQEM